MNILRVIGLLLGLVLGLLVLLPAQWLDGMVSRQTNGSIRLAAPQGSIWHGSAQLHIHPERLGDAESVLKPPIALPGRLRWRAEWAPPLGLRLWVSSPQLRGAVMEQPLRIDGLLLGKPSWQVPAGEIQLPPISLKDATGPLALVRPEFQASLSWTAFQSANPQGSALNLTLENLGSALSPIRPLGSYRLSLMGGPNPGVWVWSLQSLGDPVLRLSGEGQVDRRLRGRLVLQCARNCEFVGGILTAVGKKNGDVYEAVF